jgi:phosphomannomutase
LHPSGSAIKSETTHNESLLVKKIIAFDLDGTLAQSKQAIDNDMAKLLRELLELFPVCVISGGDWPQFERQLLGQLPDEARLADLYLMPTSGTKFYRFTDRAWREVYADTFNAHERKRILTALNEAIAEAGFAEDRVWGDRIEDRGTQITFSGLGQKAPPDAKAKWDPDLAKRSRLKGLLDKTLTDVSIRIGGSTSVDITRPGIDKAYGMRKLAELSGFTLQEMLYMGDAMYAGGNDAPVRDAGVASLAVRDIADTKLAIETILKVAK